MKIAFINPQFAIVNSNAPFKSFLSQSPYMYFYHQFWSGFSNGLLTLAALTPPEFEIRYFEEMYETLAFDEKFDIVAITANTQQAPRAYEIAGIYKQVFADKTIVAIGGPHASFEAEEAQNHCDVVFIGEAENSWPAFLRDIQQGNYRQRYNASEFDPVDLTQTPVPRYDLLSSEYYKMVWIQSSRGCPRACEFCSATKFFGPEYRTKTEAQVIAEIKAARKYLKLQQILFSDDNMFLNKERNYRLLEQIGKLNISFVAQADISIGRDPDFLDFLKDCGCSILFIGFESLDRRNLKLMNKSEWKSKQLFRYPAYINNIQQAGIGVYGAFIIGYDWDTKESFQELSAFITGNYLAGAQLTILTPLPGTEIRKRYQREGRILSKGWENYTFFDVNIKHPALSTKEIEGELLTLYRNIYCRDYLESKNRYYKQIYLRKSTKGARS